VTFSFVMFVVLSARPSGWNKYYTGSGRSILYPYYSWS